MKTENDNNEVSGHNKVTPAVLSPVPEAFLTGEERLYAEVEGIVHLGIMFVRAGLIAPATIREQILTANSMMNELLPGAMTSETAAATMWDFNYGAVAMVWEQLSSMGYVIQEEQL